MYIYVFKKNCFFLNLFNVAYTSPYMCVYRNVLSSQEVVDFVLERLNPVSEAGVAKEPMKLSTICEEVRVFVCVKTGSCVANCLVSKGTSV